MVDIRLSSLAGRLRRSEIREILKLTRTPDTISFGGGLPDPKIFPYDAVRQASEQVIKERGDLALQYSPTEGEPFFKEQIVQYCERHGEKVNADEIMVVSSSQQAIDLLAKVFIDEGDAVVIERPCYVGTLQSFRAFGADFHAVPMDQDGIMPDELERTVENLVRDGRKPKLVYLIPDFQNPSGVNLSHERRKEVLAIASRHDLLVVEDSPYRELRFDGNLLPSLYSIDQDSRVIQLKTFSKIFSPGFRIGWVAAPLKVIDLMVMAKQGTDLCTSAYISLIAAYLMRDGFLEEQIKTSRELYAHKAEVMLHALENHMPKLDDLWWSQPEGGMFLWLHLPEYMDSLELLKEAVEKKVAFVIGRSFYSDGGGRSEIRLNYSYPTDEQIVQGIQRISAIVKAHADTDTTSK